MTVFIYFLVSNPVTAILRNGIGTLDPLTAGIVIAEPFVSGALLLRVAVRLFRYGSIAYTDKLNSRAVLRRWRPATVKN